MTDRRGTRLGNYTLLQLLGTGSFADVYLAEHVYLKTQAAVKVLQTRLSTAEDMNHFLREAQLIAHLSHPHIVRVLDFGLDGQLPFLVMEYAPGGTLRERHPKGRPLPLSLVVSYVRQLADALQYAHDERVIHRDLKPENMLLGKREEVVLSDFGIALVAQSSRYQGTQEVAGTAAYMSPEQIQGKARPASDQYALGIVVYEWVSGDRPFHGSFTEVCTQHLFAPLPSLREKVPGMEPQVEQVIAQALAKEPKQRWASVQAFARALEQASQSADPTVLALPACPLPVPVTMSGKQETSSEERVGAPLAASQKEPAGQVRHQQAQVPAPRARQSGGWNLRSQQLLAMLVGIVIFGAVTSLLDLFFIAASNDGYSSAPYQSFWLFGMIGFSLLNSGVGMSLIIPAVFAARYGPWVGLISAAVGNWLGNALSGTLDASFNPWYLSLTYALFGFVAGLAFVSTQGHYRTRGARGAVVVINVVSLLISLLWQSVADSVFNPPVPFMSFYLPMALTFCFPGLFVLVCLLLFSERRVHPPAGQTP